MASSCQILKVVPQGTLLKEHSRSQPPEYLEAHPDIKRVWFDYSTMPQRNNSSMPQRDDRILEEKAEYQLMLSAISVLYLTARPHSPRRVVRDELLDANRGMLLDADGHARGAPPRNGG